MILLNVIVHVFGLVVIYDAFTFFLCEIKVRRRFMIRFAELMTLAILLIVALHGLEATAWALAYLSLGALLLPSPPCSIRWGPGLEPETLSCRHTGK